MKLLICVEILFIITIVQIALLHIQNCKLSLSFCFFPVIFRSSSFLFHAVYLLSIRTSPHCLFHVSLCSIYHQYLSTTFFLLLPLSTSLIHTHTLPLSFFLSLFLSVPLSLYICIIYIYIIYKYVMYSLSLSPSSCPFLSHSTCLPLSLSFSLSLSYYLSFLYSHASSCSFDSVIAPLVRVWQKLKFDLIPEHWHGTPH